MSNDGRNIWQLDEYTVALGDSSSGRILARQVAGPGARVLAGLVDCLLQCVIGLAVAAAIYWKHPNLVAAQDRVWFFTSAVVEWHILYFLLFEAFTFGRTPGKALVGITVVDATTGTRARSLQLIGRNLLRILDILPFHYVAAGISMALSPSRQRLGDRLCSTCVIYVNSLVEQLHVSGVPQSIYSTSQDGYMLEAFVMRQPTLHESSGPFLAREMARYFHQKYPSSDPALTRLYNEEQYMEYLKQLCAEESAAASLGSE